MDIINKVFCFNKYLIIITFSFIIQSAFSQKLDSLKKVEPLKATANININNNGISLFPNLSLGKPAAILVLSVGKKNIYFEPELRWGLSGKPWSYVFWFRYKYRKTQKFGINAGAHPSYVIKETTLPINGVQDKRYVALRYVAGEIVPTFYVSKKFSLSLQYLYSKGLDNYTTKNSHFLSLQSRISDIKLNKKYYVNFNPQIFHLVLDDKKGNYFSEFLSINKNNLPFYISSIFTYKIKSTIPGSSVVWNVGLNVKL